MFPSHDHSTIEHLIKRVKRSKLADIIVLCTTNLPEDSILCELAEKHGIEYYRGPVEDKLERWNGAAKKYNVDFFVTADGDDIFCEPELIDLAFKQREKNSSDFIEAKNIICGSFTYGISTSALQKVCEFKDTEETEMMWVYFTDTGMFDVEQLENVPEQFIRNDIRMTLDYEDDLLFFTKVFDSFNTENFSLRDIVSLIDTKPHIKKINFHLEEQWRQNQILKTSLKLK